ncbi:hypothetical protein [Roseovarius autotrophicus]|uniref:hypothetical protein n=1 Tax=Roseovarius autotrophicus TaxID=2824121 RepID=UPI001B394472|nr:hypothetical protein [Roseovarius autotrophicus]
MLRWFMAPLVLLALGLAGILMAGAHPIQDHSEHSMAAAISDIAPDGHGCCDEADPGHITGSCLGVGHCVACATGNAGMSAPKFSPETCFGLRLIILPSGLASGPSGRPPKAS